MSVVRILRVVCQLCHGTVVLAVACSAGWSAAFADEPVVDTRAQTQSADDAHQVATLFRQRCYECHGPEAREGGLRLTSRADLLARNDSGHVAVLVGRSQESELVRRVSVHGEQQMPPEGLRLTSVEVDLLRRWIDAGAAWPETASKAPPHWAYQPPVRPIVPDISPAADLQNPLDVLVAAALQAQQPPQTMSPRELPARLLRRVYLDLTGLPPAPDAVDAFVAEPSQAAWEQVVEQLLASPQYGERWAQHWLDLARYADSNGYQADQFRSVWPYRDWVIRAFNQDLPFDQFTIQQLAGDLLPEAAAEQRIATGFHRCTTCNVEAGVDPEENRTNQVADRVTTTATVWLGTTLECARCHNHKYDPFTQQDFYQLFAFFNNTPLEVEPPTDGGVQYEVAGPMLEVPLSEEQRVAQQVLQQRLLQARAEYAARLEQLERGEHTLAIREAQQSSVRSAAAMARPSAAATEPSVPAAASGATEPEATWQILAITQFAASGGARGIVQPDQSLLVTGPTPSTDTYTITVDTQLSDIRGLRLETLTDPSLPGSGPGRTDARRPNFVLYEVSVTAEPLQAALEPESQRSPRPVRFTSAAADFAQTRWPAAGLIDGNPATGWAIAPEFGKPHAVELRTESPVGYQQGTRLVLQLPQQFGNGRTIGRLRLSALTTQTVTHTPPSEILAVLNTAVTERTEVQREQLRQYLQVQDAQLQALQRQIAECEAGLQQFRPGVTAVMQELSKPRETFIFKRGDFLTPGAAVQPQTPAALPPLQTVAGQRPTRLDLARWLVDRGNPLTARVIVNRWWAEFFGRGLVDTLEDFGTQGSRPSHPELLDWLAVEFMESGWSMKHVHRLIVTSAVYQQSSRITEEQRERDPFNIWLARGPRQRLAAESIRDNALAISGLLSLRMGGPPVYPPQPENIWRHVGRNAPKYETDTDADRYRRGVYVVWRRSAPYPSFVNFDAPDRASCVVRRSRSNTPLQALTLMNDPAYIEMAHALARRILTERPQAGLQERLEYGFRLCVARPPTAAEVLPLADLWTAQAARYARDAAAVSQLLQNTDRCRDVSASEQAAWFTVASVLLNLDETITKN